MAFDRSTSLLNSITAHVSQSMVGSIRTQSLFHSIFGNIGDAGGNAYSMDPFERTAFFTCGYDNDPDSGSKCGGNDAYQDK